MSMTSRHSKSRYRWDERAYHTIIRARYDWDGTTLTVEFENGDRVQLDPKLLLPKGTDLDDMDWNRIGSNETEVLIPIGNSWLEVPWDVIRDLTDEEFAAHWAELDRQIAEKTGIRIRTMREERRLPIWEVAQRAGVSNEDVERIEAGTHDPHFNYEPILAAFGRTRQDLIEALKTEPAVHSGQ